MKKRKRKRENGRGSIEVEVQRQRRQRRNFQKANFPLILGERRRPLAERKVNATMTRKGKLERRKKWRMEKESGGGKQRPSTRPEPRKR